MQSQDSIADLLTCLRNAQVTGLKFFCISHSSLKEAVLNVLFQSGYIFGFFVLDGNKKVLVVFPKFCNFIPAIKSLVRLSKPSVRVYFDVGKLCLFSKNLGVIVFSSSFGTINSSDARFLHCGGEALCVVG